MPKTPFTQTFLGSVLTALLAGLLLWFLTTDKLGMRGTASLQHATPLSSTASPPETITTPPGRTSAQQSSALPAPKEEPNPVTTRRGPVGSSPTTETGQSNASEEARSQDPGHDAPTPDADEDSQRSAPTTRDEKAVIKNSFRFERPDCTLHGDLIKCSFTVTNLVDTRRPLELSTADITGQPRSFLIDKTGERFPAADCEIGGVPRFMFNCAQPLEPDIPIRASMTFSAPNGEIPAGPTAISIYTWDSWKTQPVVVVFKSVVIH